jgi:nucleotide-binding universal stress UspA family protein
MKHVLCPVDFSVASRNGMEYAARLAKALSARLTLFYVMPSIWPEAVQLERESIAGLEEINETLRIFSAEVHKEFSIACDYAIEQTTGTIEEAIAAKAITHDLVVLGTNGADNLYRHVFGSRTFHVIEQTKCPVVMVPKGLRFNAITKIVYAYDPHTNPIFLIDQLMALAVPLKAEIRVVHIETGKPSKETEKKLEVLKEAIRAREKKPVSWSFDFQYSDDVAFALNSYLAGESGSMLALSGHHRSAMEKLFEENVVKQVSRLADYPVLVFWH